MASSLSTTADDESTRALVEVVCSKTGALTGRRELEEHECEACGENFIGPECDCVQEDDFYAHILDAEVEDGSISPSSVSERNQFSGDTTTSSPAPSANVYELSDYQQQMVITSPHWTFAIDKTTFPKCGACFRAQHVCDRKDPCAACSKRRRKCLDVTDQELQLYSDRARKVLQKAEALKENRPKEQITEEKVHVSNSDAVGPGNACQTCKFMNRNCDGQKSYPQIPGSEPQCVYCHRRGFACDRGRPCKTCEKNEKLCSYRDLNGRVVRSYNMNALPTSRGRPHVHHAEEKCTRCKHLVRYGRCSQGKPCHDCVSACIRNLVSSQTFCIYYFPQHNGMSESWLLRCWTLGRAEDGRPDLPVILKENWQDVIDDYFDGRRTATKTHKRDEFNAGTDLSSAASETARPLSSSNIDVTSGRRSQCPVCSYGNQRRYEIKRHMLEKSINDEIHLNACKQLGVEGKKLFCGEPMCKYATFIKSNLKKHKARSGCPKLR